MNLKVCPFRFYSLPFPPIKIPNQSRKPFIHFKPNPSLPEKLNL
jgi:hypothetical protein